MYALEKLGHMLCKLDLSKMYKKGIDIIFDCVII